MVKNRRQLQRQVGAKVPAEISHDITTWCTRELGEHPFRSDTDSEVVVLAFLHYITHEEDSFKSIESQFGLAHTNFNYDFYTILRCAREWAKTKFPPGSLASRQAAALRYVRFSTLQHTTLLCDSKVFLRQKTRGTNRNSKWWWGPKRCKGTKVMGFVSHDKIFRLLLGPFHPYAYDANNVTANRRPIQRIFHRDDVVMADNHFSKMKNWRNVSWVIKHRKPKGRPLTKAQQQFNKEHMKVGLAHMEGAWGSVTSLFPKLRKKMALKHDEHYALILIACAIHNIKREKKINN
jgi:hypothetical protein